MADSFVLGKGFTSFVRELGFNPNTQLREHAKPAMVKRIPSALVEFPTAELKDAAMKDPRLLAEVHDIENRCRDSIKQTLDAAKNEGRYQQQGGNLTGKDKSSLRSFEQVIHQLGERAASLELQISQRQTAQRVDDLEKQSRQTQEDVEEISDTLHLAISDRVRSDRSSVVRIMLALAAATTALMAYTFQFSSTAGKGYSQWVWVTLIAGVVVIGLGILHSLFSSKLAQKNLDHLHNGGLPNWDEVHHVPGTSWVIAMASVLGVQAIAAALALAASVI